MNIAQKNLAKLLHSLPALRNPTVSNLSLEGCDRGATWIANCWRNPVYVHTVEESLGVRARQDSPPISNVCADIGGGFPVPELRDGTRMVRAGCRRGLGG